jgi:flagellar biosynthetic protein FlhB
MAESSPQDRTEEPTARKLSKAREDGQIARSTELPAAAIVIGSLSLIFAMSGWLAMRVQALFTAGFVFDMKVLRNAQLMPSLLMTHLLDAFSIILPILLLTACLAVFASGITGGYFFALKAVLPKGSKLNPFEGFKRMFGPRAFVELGKSLLKFLLVAGALWWSIAQQLDTLVQIGSMALEPALLTAGQVISRSAVLVALSLAVIALIDAPYQKSQFIKRMRMTKQEVKDEFKDVEGRPEVRAQIRRRQREMANSRMMQRVKEADVVITNPMHFAVALEYDIEGDRAPVVVAKGTDFMANRIREEAAKHGVHILQSPALARALYFTTDVEHPIPEPLYRAVAEVIAYVFNLEATEPNRHSVTKPDPKVPASMQFDANGRRA